MGDSARARTVKSILRAIRDLNPDIPEKEAKRLFVAAIIGSTPEEISSVRSHLMGPDPDPAELERAAGMVRAYIAPIDQVQLNAIAKADIVFVTPGAKDALAARPRKAYVFDPIHPEASLKHVAGELWAHDLRLSIARHFPAFRQDFGSRITQQVTLENTLFVVATGLGNVVPNILAPLIGITEAVSDTVFLTANQIRMLFMLGAAFGVKTGYRAQWKEISSILGAALGWRSLARSVVSIIPFGGGVVLKGNIAYAGTMAVGHGVIFLYANGRRMTRQEIASEFKRHYSEALEFVRSVVGRLRPPASAGDSEAGSADS